MWQTHSITVDSWIIIFKYSYYLFCLFWICFLCISSHPDFLCLSICPLTLTTAYISPTFHSAGALTLLGDSINMVPTISSLYNDAVHAARRLVCLGLSQAFRPPEPNLPVLAIMFYPTSTKSMMTAFLFPPTGTVLYVTLFSLGTYSEQTMKN